MIIVSNRIKVKPGFALKMAPNFTKPGPLQQFEGFHKVEVLVSTDNPEFDEMSVNMYWDSKEAFAVWRESDAFKESHKRPEQGSAEANAQQENSPMLGSQIVVAELVSFIEKN